jgi:uncharacterized membrane protein YfcA
MLDRRILMIMCGFGLLGQLLGWLLFDYLSDRLLTSLIGLIAIITAMNYGWRLYGRVSALRPRLLQW